MKKNICAALLMLLASAAPCVAMQNDEAEAEVGKCLNESRWFRLQDIYATDSARLSPMMSCFAKAMLCTVFNRPREATEAIATLVNGHQQEIGAANVVSMMSLLGYNYSAMGDNAKAADVLKKLLGALEGHADSATVAGLRCQKAVYETFGKYELYRRGRGSGTTSTAHFTLDRVGGDSTQVLMHIDGKLNGRRCQATFDTGSAYNVVTPELAARHNLILTDAQLPVVGTRDGMGRIAIARELSVGKLTLRNVPFVVLDFSTDNHKARQAAKAYQCILGQSLLMQFAAYTIDFSAHTVTFSCDTTVTRAQRSNICIEVSGKAPSVEVAYGGKAFGAKIDTGAGRTMLGSAFYRDNSAVMARDGKWAIAASSGYGGVTYDSVFRLPELTMSVDGKTFTLHDVSVSGLSTGNALSAGYGRLGLDFFRAWRKVRVDNVAMRLTVE